MAIQLAPAYWRLLVMHAPGTAIDRLRRDIRTGRFSREALLARGRDLRDHIRSDIRARARSEIVPELGLTDDLREESANPG
jgi:hypothetical protein